jgi:hypothetical protein
MAIRTKILVVDSDLDTLSRIYLALVHRNYKVEASDKTEEIAERMKRLKPALLILGKKEYLFFEDKLKTPCIVLWESEEPALLSIPGDVFVVKKPVSLELLIHKIEEMVY